MAVRGGPGLNIPPLCVVGANHNSMPVAGREILASLGKDEQLLDRLQQECGLDNCAVLSTCNRFEVITFNAGKGAEISEFLLSNSQGNLAEQQLYCLVGLDAARHFFRVTASLDSMVLGEAQILGQVKECYRRAIESRSVNKLMHHLFQYSFRLAKKIRSSTEIARGGVSISYVAVKLAEQIFETLSDRSIMIVGSGEMAELCLLHLRAHGCRNVIVANRTLSKAESLARHFGGRAITLSEVDQQLNSVDVVIGSITADMPLINKQSLINRRGEPLFFIDLGVPRNFHPRIAELEGIYLYNIDDLSKIAEDNQTLRAEAAEESELLIDCGVIQFQRWLERVAQEPYLLDLREYIRQVCDEEIKAGLASLAAQDMTEIDLGALLSAGISEKLAFGFTKILEEISEDYGRSQQCLSGMAFHLGKSKKVGKL